MTPDELLKSGIIVVPNPPKRGRPTNEERANRAAAMASQHKQTAIETTLKLNSPSKSTISELYSLIDTLKNEIKVLKAENQARKNEIEMLKSERTRPKETKQSLNMVNAACKESKERARRSMNVVLRGELLTKDDTSGQHDRKQAEKFLSDVCPDLEVNNITNVQRLYQKKEAIGKAFPSLLVTLNSTDTVQKVLKYARHHTHEQWTNVFAHEDRTEAEQFQFYKCKNEADTKNDNLRKHELFNQYQYVIRGDRVRCIDRIKSTELRQSIYVSDEQIKQHLDNERNRKRKQLDVIEINRLDEAINNSYISNRQSTLTPSAVIGATPPVPTETAGKQA